MSDLVRAVVIAGLISGTQPLTIMGLLLVMAGRRPRPNGWAYIAGALLVETTVLLVANLLVGAAVEPGTGPARAFLGVRIALGLALVVVGLRLRRPAKKPQPEVPKALERLQHMDPRKSFVAGVALADYQGAVIASLALTAADVGSSGRLLSIALYTSLASGIPVALMLAITLFGADPRPARLGDQVGDAEPAAARIVALPGARHVPGRRRRDRTPAGRLGLTGRRPRHGRRRIFRQSGRREAARA